VSGLVFALDPAPKLLLHQHKRYQLLLPPGGHVEADEHPWPAVLRELREEAGIVPEQLQVLLPPGFTVGPGRFPVPVALDVHEVEAGWAHTDLGFAFVIDGGPRLAPDPGESLELHWLPVAEVADRAGVPKQVAELAAQVASQLEEWKRIPVPAIGLSARPRSSD
jgi:8-oxo-dGTP pyrophosphatase MutT (NUDIX family)